MGAPTDPDHALADILRRQHGLISRSQALSIGFNENQIRYRLSRKLWLQVDYRVYRHHLISPSWHAKVLAPCLSLGAVASHRTAAALWELDGFARGRPEILLPKHAGKQRDGIRIHETTLFAERQTTMRMGIPTTGIERTLIDLAKVVPPAKLRQAVDSARLQELVDWPGIGRSFSTHARRGRDGIASMRLYLEDHLGEESIPLSDWSRLVADLLIDAGLPAPELEYTVVGPGYRYVVDLAYPDLRVGIELDSVTWHLNRQSFHGDRRRLNRLQDLGWSMRLFTWEDYSRRPADLVASVRTACRQQRAA